MQKNIGLFLALILVLIVGSSLVVAEDDSLARIKEAGKFVVGLDDNFPPMGFRNEAGEIVGFDIDLAREAAKRLGVEVVFKPVEWDGIIFSLKNGTIDVIWNGLTITEERSKQILFTDPYMNNRQIVIVKADSTLDSKTDLKGKVLGLQMGSTSEAALEAEAEIKSSLAEVRKYANNVEALMDLQIGRLDAVLVDEIVGRYYISKKPGIYRVLEDDFGKEEYGVGIRKEDRSFRDALNEVLAEIKADGTGEEISKKWFGENILK